MSNKKAKLPNKSDYIINALATYICVEAGRRDIFTKEVDISHISEMLNATELEQNEAYIKAKDILRLFFNY